MNRKELYMLYFKLTQEEVMKKSELDCELDIRKIPNYCTNLSVPRCSECSLTNYNRDCHNNIVAREEA